MAYVFRRPWFPRPKKRLYHLALSAGAGEADGSSTAVAGGATLEGSAVGHADGSASVSGGGASRAGAAGEADGHASVIGSPAHAGAGEADGSATVSGASAGVVLHTGAGEADGASTATGGGRSLASGAGEADGTATVSGGRPGPSTGEADGSSTATGGGARIVSAAGEADGAADVHGASTVAGPFFLAWADATETTFGPQHLREDELILKFEREQTEGQAAILTLEIVNPFTGLLAASRKQWAWFSYRKLDSTIVPLFFGRLIAVPGDIDRETVTLHFVAQPFDLLDHKRAVASTLMVRPYWDPVWEPEPRRLDPDAVIEGYSAAWHIDPVTLTVTISDYVNGEDGTVSFSDSQAFYDNFKYQIERAPLKSVYVNATVSWVQYAIGTIDMGNKLFNAISGAGLVSSWPKYGSQLGSGWTVAHSYAGDNNGPVQSGTYIYKYVNKMDTHLFGDVMNFDSTLTTPVSPPISTAFWQVVTDEQADGQEGDEEEGIAAWGRYSINKTLFFSWTVKTMLVLRYEAKRERTENVRFILGANLQPVFTDPGGTAANFAQDSELLQLEGKVGLEGPYGTFRGEWQPNTQYHLFDLFTTGTGTFGWQVLQDHLSLGSFDEIGTAGAFQGNTWYDAGQNFFAGGNYYQVLISGISPPSFSTNYIDPFTSTLRYALLPDPHQGPRLYANIPGFRGNWVGGGEILVAGDLVYAPDGMMYRVVVGHHTAATFDRFASDPTGQLLYSLLVNPAPIGDISRRSYFPQDRGFWSLENLICRARAHLLQRSRSAHVSWECPFELALPLTLRKNATVADRRVPGGSATGKVVSIKLSGDGDRGTIIGGCSIASAVGLGGSVSGGVGAPTYVATGYVDYGYQAYTGSVTALPTGDVGYSPPIDAVVDDGLIFPLTKDTAVTGENTITFTGASFGPPSLAAPGAGTFVNGAQQLADKAQQAIQQFQTNVANTQTSYALSLRPVQNGPFAAEYDVVVSALYVPQQIDLTS